MPQPEIKEAPRQPLWVRWVALTVFVALLGVVFVNLGEWQLRRLHERRANNQITRTNEAAPLADFDQVFTHTITDADEWRRVTVTGTFDSARQYIIRYRNNGDDDGYEVVTPLHTTSGKNLLVDRGFVVLMDGTRIPNTAPPPPSGQVTILGRVRQNESGHDSALVPVDGHARSINSDKLGADLKMPVVNGYLDALSMTPTDTITTKPIPLPELDDGPHFWYAVQWFMFTGIGALGVVVFIRGDLRDRRERLEQQAKDEARERARQQRADADKEQQEQLGQEQEQATSTPA